MATIVSHAVVAITLGKLSFCPGQARIWSWAVICAILPDIDVLAFRLGIPYESMWGHRGITHSLMFAMLTGFAIALLVFRDEAVSMRIRLGLYFFLVAVSHGVLDAMTSGGLGIAFFAPFDNSRIFFDVRPIEVSPIGLSFFSARGVTVIYSEIRYIIVPSLVLLLCTYLFCKYRRARHSRRQQE